MNNIYGGNFKITKPIRIIELFAGYGSQHFALKYLGANFESWKICEWSIKSIQAYKDAHFDFDNTDYSKNFTFDYIIEYLYNKGISSNYSEPMKYKSIKRLGEEKVRNIYNNIISTHNLVNIKQVSGKDLEIVDVDKYCYLITYSFPCQDLSVAGLGKGMAKDSGTRSGMLWEVERILDEINDSGGNLPQILIMENVPQVHGTKNKKDFDTWIEKLKSLGYSNFWQDLNAKDFGVPQNRKRCFMVSILGDFKYEFPKTKVLDKKLKDLLDENVDESFYLSDSKINKISQWKAYQDPLKDIDKEKELCPCLTARGAGEEHSGMVLVNEEVYNLKRKLCNKLIEDEMVKTTTYPNGYGHGSRTHNESIALNTVDKPSVKNNNRIRKLTPKECFRLMGVKDEDFERIAKNQSNQSLYHLAGDSIVVNVLIEIFSKMF